jgi:hypothetical protein
VKPVEYLEKGKGISESKFNELETNKRNKNIRDLYRDISEFTK